MITTSAVRPALEASTLISAQASGQDRKSYPQGLSTGTAVSRETRRRWLVEPVDTPVDGARSIGHVSRETVREWFVNRLCAQVVDNAVPKYLERLGVLDSKDQCVLRGPAVIDEVAGALAALAMGLAARTGLAGEVVFHVKRAGAERSGSRRGGISRC